MFDKKMLKVMIKERLSETAEEIFQLFEQAAAEYQREIDRLKNVGEASGAKPINTVKSLSLDIVQQTLVLGEGENSAGSALVEENTGVLPTAMETEEVVTVQEDELEVFIANVNSFSSVKELQPCGQEQNENSVGQILLEARGGAQTDNINTGYEQDLATINNYGHAGSQESPCCWICKESFPHWSVLEMHLKSIHPNPPEPSTSAESTEQEHPDQDLTKPTFSCNVCGKKFKQRNTWRIHEKQHSGNYPLKCITCAVTFIKETPFIRHMQTVHNIDRAFRCPVCDKGLKTYHAFSTHIQLHSASKQRHFLCPVCGALLPSEDSFVNHLILHKEYIANKDFFGRSLKTIDEITI